MYTEEDLVQSAMVVSPTQNCCQTFNRLESTSVIESKLASGVTTKKDGNEIADSVVNL